MDIRALFGRNLKRIRTARGVTQEKLAEKTGLSQQHISIMEQGRGNPTIVSVALLAEALEVSHVDLMQPDEAG